jgi:hypothetical protein
LQSFRAHLSPAGGVVESRAPEGVMHDVERDEIRLFAKALTPLDVRSGSIASG